MLNPRFVVGGLAAAVSLSAIAGPAAASEAVPSERPTITLDAVTWHDPGTITVKGTYSCPVDASRLESVQVWTEQRNRSKDLWLAGYAVTAEDAACDGKVHPFEVTIQSEDGNHDRGTAVRVEGMASTVNHRMNLVESFFVPQLPPAGA